ncbi:MAG TPA: two-component regulator propeller domain-containing protein [Cyclobacteriaceae bacterium]|nr:two-component regulator propeller domain-containing protein [Cyclobacteriaceae bacterium]
MGIRLLPKPLLFALFSIQCWTGLYAQTNRNYIFDHLTVDDGLSQSTVFAITKDTDGYLWFGTRDGLSRFDARNIKVYRNNVNDPNSLSGNSIQCFFNDPSDGALWIGTSEGLSIYNAAQDNFIQSKLDPDSNERLSDNHVTDIMQDNDGYIWVATYNGLNKVISKNPLRYQHFKHDESNERSLLNNEIRALFLDSGGELWIGTALGVSRMQKTDDGNIQFINYRLPAKQLKGKSWINCLNEDDQGNLLIGTEENGAKMLDKKTGIIRPMKLDALAGRPIESVRVIERNGKHEYWFGTIDGLFIYNDSKNDVVTLRNNPEENTTLSDNSVRSIFIDQSQTYWIGTFYGGVNSYSPLSRQFGEVMLTNKTMQKAYKVAGAMVTDRNNNLWISTDGNGLYCLNEKGETIKQFKHNPNDPGSISHNKIKSLLLVDDGLWIGTINGLNYLNFQTGKLNHFFNEPGNMNSLPDDRVYDVKKDSEGFLWIATYRGGLCRYDEKTKTFHRYTHNPANDNSLSSDGVTFILEDFEGDLWIGTISGLNKKRKGENIFERLGNHAGNNPNGGGDYILCLYEDKNKNLWIGTRDTGLKLKSSGSNEIRQFTLEDGLPGNNISGIQEDSKGFLWISTDNGLSRLDPVSFKFKNYNKSDGLACREFNFNSFHKDRKGYLYFGGYNGIIKFHPDSVLENDQPPPVAFTRLKIFNKEVPVGKGNQNFLAQTLSRTETLTFNYRQNIFSIEFAGLSFINPNKNRYAYKLEGFEDQWNYVVDPVATYMNLQPGDYTLMAKASNNDGYWTPDPIRLGIHVLPPPWKTWWAYTIYAGIILGLLFALIRFNKMRWKLAHDLQLEHLEKEQQDKLHRAKLNFFTNVAHEIRTPLTLIVSPVEVVEERYAEDAFLQRQLRVVKSNTTRLMRLINQLLDFQKQESGNFKLKTQSENIVELLKEIVFSFTEHANVRHIKLKFTADHSCIDVPFDRDEIEKVFCNLLHNAFKFTPSGGEIAMTVTLEGSFVKILVEDNGIGIPSEDLPRIFDRFFQADHNNISESGFGIGLALAKGIIQLHGGSIGVESHEAELGQSGFTKFTIRLPLIDAATSVPEQQVHENITGDVVNVHQSHEDDTEGSVDDKGKDQRPSVLLIEDNIEIRTVLRTILESSYDILEASNGKEGWDIITEQLPDVIISDIAMPQMDGIQLTRLVKTDLRTDHIPVILLTARGAFEHHVEGMETGADDYITKPFHARILQLKVKNLLETREKLKAKYHRVVTLEPTHEELEDPENKFLMKLKHILEANLNDPDFNVSKLVSEIGMSRPVLFRKIKMLTGHSVIDLIRSTRLKKAEMLLKQKKLSISEIAFTVGFNDPKYFSKSFRAQFGKTPTEYMESLN